MKRCLGLVLLFITFLPQSAWAGVDDFSIALFEADYYLSQTEDGYSRLSVVEKLVVEFPNFDQNHGILRAIPLSYNDYPLNLSVTSVTNAEDQPYIYETYEDNGNLVLKIGDPNRFALGQTTYLIRYELANVISFFPDHDELFWDINGDQWPQRFGQVTARVHVPVVMANSLQDRQICYSGPAGSLEQNCQISRQRDANGGIIVTAVAQSLEPFANLSIVLGWEPNTFQADPWPHRWQVVRWSLGGLMPLLSLAWITRRWQKYGRDPRGRGIIVPEYVPLKNVGVLAADTILHERLRTEAVSAAIIELATRSYLTIHEITKKKLLGKNTQYELELAKAPTDLTADERAVIELMFGKNYIVGSKINLSEQANKFYTEVQALQRDLPKRLTKDGYFRSDPNSQRSRYYLLGFAVIFVSFITLVWAPWLGVGLLLSGLVVLIFARNMPARTNEGVRVRDHLLGLEDYIKLAEAERIRYLQSPEGVKQYGDPDQPKSKLKLFETLLPYAMLFGLEKDWAKQFEHLYSQPPSWYSGTSGHFSTLHLANSLNTLENQSVRAFSPPSSSGSSGFSGGGGSGGGGGGGGGGGW